MPIDDGYKNYTKQSKNKECTILINKEHKIVPDTNILSNTPYSFAKCFLM